MNLPELFILIDDDPINNWLTKISIRKVIERVEVIEFTVPEEGIEFITSEFESTPVKSVLLLDINMPSLTGWDVLAQLMEKIPWISQYVAIYILSSSVDPRDRSKAEENPMVVGYLEKPLSPDFLKELISGT